MLSCYGRLFEDGCKVKRSGRGVHILACELPTQSPWLTPIEPKWMHDKRAICESDRELSADDVIERTCAYYDCRPLPRLAQKTD